MSKAINWNNFNQGFGESFNQTITELRRLREQREQFDQEMGFRERQLNLNMGIAEKNYGLNKMQEDRLSETTKAEFQKDYIPLSGEFDLMSGFKAFQEAPPESIQSGKDIQENFPILGEGLKQGLYANKNLIPETPKAEPLFDITETFPNEQGIPTVYGISKTTLDKFPLGVDYDEQTQRINANKSSQNPNQTTPYVNQVELEQTLNTYKELSNLKPNEDEQYQFYDNSGKLQVMDEKGLETIKNRTYERTKILAEDKARWYNQHYANFDQAYKSYRKDLESGDITLESLDSVIEEEMGDAPIDVKEQLKSLLKMTAPIQYKERIL